MRLSVTPSYYQKHKAERRARLALIAEDIFSRAARLASLAIALAEAIACEQHEPERDLVILTYVQLCYTSRRPASRRFPRALSLCYSQQLQQNVYIQRKRRDSAARRKGVRLHTRKHAMSCMHNSCF